MTGSLLVRHSQSSSTPLCGEAEVKLWDGYSMLHIEGNGKAHHQDLGQFIPFLFSYNFIMKTETIKLIPHMIIFKILVK